MRVLKRYKLTYIVLFVLLLLPGTILAQNYIEVWPEGWSDIRSLFTTSIFTDRFFVVEDQGGTSFLSADGLYFKELDLTYRFIGESGLNEEVVLRSKAEIDSTFLGLDKTQRRHVLWLERSAAGNGIYYTSFTPPYTGHEVKTILETDRSIQDLAAVQVGPTTHLVWSERDEYFQINYAQIESGEIKRMETVTDTVELSIRPNAIVDDQGQVHLVWMESAPLGIDLFYSKRNELAWANPQKIGAGSTQDVQQGGTISLAVYNNDVHVAWAAIPRNQGNLFVHLAQISSDGVISSPTPFALGSKARFVVGADEPELVWQGVGPFGAQINHASYQGEVTNLTVGRKGAFRPEAFVKQREGYHYVYWLQAHSEQGFEVFVINNQYPKAMSIWRKVGLDEEAPVFHLLFLVMSTLMLAGVYTILNLAVMLISGVVYSLVQRFEAYRKQPFFYQVALLSIILIVVRRLPIPAGNPEFFGFVHYGLSIGIATLGTFFILRRVNQRGLFLQISMLLIWMFLFQFFALIPQSILS